MAKTMPEDMAASASADEPTAFAALSKSEQAARRRAKLRKVRVSLLKAHPRQPAHRHAVDAVKELAESIARHGLLQPPLARRLKDGSYRLLAGHRRTVSWQYLTFQGVVEERIPVWVIEDMTDAEEAYAIAAEYSHRREYDMIHTAEVIGRAWEERRLELGREPTCAEVADVVPWGSTSVGAYRKVYEGLQDEALAPLIQSLNEPDISLVYNILAANQFSTQKDALKAYREEGPSAARKALKHQRKGGRPRKVVTKRKVGDGYNLTIKVRDDLSENEIKEVAAAAEALLEQLKGGCETAA